MIPCNIKLEGGIPVSCSFLGIRTILAAAFPVKEDRHQDEARVLPHNTHKPLSLIVHQQ